MQPDNRDFKIGELSADVSGLKSSVEEVKKDVKTIKDNVQSLKDWKLQVLTVCGVASFVISSLFYGITMVLKLHQ